MSVLEHKDIAQRVSAALEAAVAADAGELPAPIAFIDDVAPAEASVAEDLAVEDVAVVAPTDVAEPVAEKDDDDIWVVPTEPVDSLVESAPSAAGAPVAPVKPVDARPKRSRKRLVVAAGLLVVAGAGVWAAVVSRHPDRQPANAAATVGSDATSSSTAVGSEDAVADAPTLRGTFTVWNGGTATDPCAPIRSGDEPIQGDQVRLRGTDGGRLIMGALGAGSPTAGNRGCAFPFVLPNIPPADKYIVAVSPQGSLIFTREQLAAVHWRVSMSFGSPTAS